jgi:hypothetical protein
MALFTRSDKWISASDSESDFEERSDILGLKQSHLLYALTGIDEETEVALTRTFSFPLTTMSSISKKEIQVELNDAPPVKEDHRLQSWGSSILLTECVASNLPFSH